jgi:hypothetical protein
MPHSGHVAAGFAILHLYLVYYRTSDSNFLSYYANVAQGISLIYYHFVVLATVSSLTRFFLVRQQSISHSLPSACTPLLLIFTHVCLLLLHDVLLPVSGC